MLSFLARVTNAVGPALTAFELVPRIGIDLVLRHGLQVRDPFAAPHAWYVLFELSSTREDGPARALSEAMLERLKKREIDEAAIAMSLAQAQEFWRLREQMSEVQRKEGGSIKHDVAMPVTKVQEFITHANQLAD